MLTDSSKWVVKTTTIWDSKLNRWTFYGSSIEPYRVTYGITTSSQLRHFTP